MEHRIQASTHNEMKQSERILEAQIIGQATTLLEQMNTRLAAGGRNWGEKQHCDWQRLRQLCNQTIARYDGCQGTQQSETKPADLFRTPQEGAA